VISSRTILLGVLVLNTIAPNTVSAQSTPAAPLRYPGLYGTARRYFHGAQDVSGSHR